MMMNDGQKMPRINRRQAENWCFCSLLGRKIGLSDYDRMLDAMGRMTKLSQKKLHEDKKLEIYNWKYSSD